MPDKRMSSQYEDSDLYSTPNLIRRDILREPWASQSSASTPASEGGLLKISSRSSFCALLSFAAFLPTA